MTQRTIALIGHSGAGKSVCLKTLAEMDMALGTGKSPSLDEALNWILRALPVIVVSVHMDMLREMSAAKGRGRSEEFSKMLFVYLYKDKVRLERHLEEDVQRGFRKIDNKQATLTTYEELDGIFRVLADHIIDSTEMDINQVVEEIRRLKVRL